MLRLKSNASIVRIGTGACFWVLAVVLPADSVAQPTSRVTPGEFGAAMTRYDKFIPDIEAARGGSISPHLNYDPCSNAKLYVGRADDLLREFDGLLTRARASGQELYVKKLEDTSRKVERERLDYLLACPQSLGSVVLPSRPNLGIAFAGRQLGAEFPGVGKANGTAHGICLDAEQDFWGSALRYAGEFSGFRIAAGVQACQGFGDARENLGAFDGVIERETSFIAGLRGGPLVPMNGVVVNPYVDVGAAYTRFKIEAAPFEHFRGWRPGLYVGGGVSVTVPRRSFAGGTLPLDAAAVELYLQYRHYDYGTATLNGGARADVSVDEVMAGARIVFGSDIRLKRDIERVGDHAGIGLYRYRYLWNDQVYVGVMAQEVVQIVPDAVLRGADGYLRVDYGLLGLHPMTWEQWVAERIVTAEREPLGIVDRRDDNSTN